MASNIIHPKYININDLYPFRALIWFIDFFLRLFLVWFMNLFLINTIPFDKQSLWTSLYPFLSASTQSTP